EAVATEVLQPQTQPAQQQGHVGSLGAVVGVELIEHDVLQRVGGELPHQLVGVPKQQLIEHLVVRQQDVRRVLAHGVPVGDQQLLGDLLVLGAEVLDGVNASSHACQLGLGA